VLFKQAYLKYNGVGAFEQMIADIPEPASFLLLAMGCVVLLDCPFARRDRHRSQP
jgi:hypothetical protein